MDRAIRLASFLGLAGLTLMGVSCTKSVQGGAGSKSSEKGQTGSLVPGGAGTGSVESGLKEQGLSRPGAGSKSSEQDQAGSLVPGGAGTRSMESGQREQGLSRPGAGSKSSEQDQAGSLVPGGAGTGPMESGQREQGLPGSLFPRGTTGAGPTDSGPEEQSLSRSGAGGSLPSVEGVGPDSGPLKGFESVGPGGQVGEERLAGGGSGPLMAKADSGQAAGSLAEQIQHEESLTAAAGLQDVFFGFDSWEIPDHGKQSLALNANWLKTNPDKRLRIEGHCDERGTGAYNFELGRKRANAVRNYLMDLGIGSRQLNMTSYGKTRPFCKDHDESCYQQNRRSHVVVSLK